MFVAFVAVYAENALQDFGTYSVHVSNLLAIETALRHVRSLAVAGQVTESPTPVTLSQVQFLQRFPDNNYGQLDNSN